MDEKIIFNSFFIAIGLFAILSSWANWDFFFNHRKAQFFVKILGRKGARIFYIVLGSGFLVLGLLSVFGIVNLGN